MKRDPESDESEANQGLPNHRRSPGASQPPGQNPIYVLAQRVRGGELTPQDAAEKAVTEPLLLHVDDDVIAELDTYVHQHSRRELPWSTLLAVLNCRAAREVGNDVSWGRCNATLGWLYQQQGELDSALYHYREALTVFQRLLSGAMSAIAQTKLDAGQVKERQGDREAAAAEYRAALRLGKEMNDRQIEGDAWSGLGRVHLSQEQADAALSCFNRALDLSEEHNDQRGKETALGNLGQVYHFLGRLTEANRQYSKGLRISREIGHLAGTGRHLSQRGSVLHELGKFAEAEGDLQEALQIARDLGDRWAEQQRLGNLGKLHLSRATMAPAVQAREDCLTRAREAFQEALTIAEERDDGRAEASLRTNLGITHSGLADTARAEAQYRKALALAEACGTADTQWRVHYHWGDLCALRHDQQEAQEDALKHYRAAIEIVEAQRHDLRVESRMHFWQERSNLYRQAVLCCLRLGAENLWPSLSYAEQAKARYLADLSGQHTMSMAGIQETAQSTLSPGMAVVVFTVTASGTAVFVVTSEPVEHTPLDPGWVVSPDGRVRARLVSGFDRDRLQRLLLETDGADEVIGGYLGDYHRYIDCSRELASSRDTDRLQTLLRRQRQRRENWFATLETVGTAVYDELLAYVHQELAMLPVKRVILMPDLGLTLLPLHACRSGRGSLWDDYETAYVPSFQMLALCCQGPEKGLEDGQGRLLAVANPTGDLQWAESEVLSVAALFPQNEDGVRILGSADRDCALQATPEAIVAQAPNYDTIHFACHGLFELREPLHSHLVLAGGRPLTAKKIFEDVHLPHTRLVVMSACETGLVAPNDLANEYIGLAGALLHAGAQAVIVSLWAVDDWATALLMQRLYEAWNHGSMPVAAALQQAQDWLRTASRQQVRDDLEKLDATQPPWAAESKNTTMREPEKTRKKRTIARLKSMDDPPLTHPYWWAGFQVVGDAL